MTWSLKGKVALITGSSRGIGKEIAIALAKQGVRVVIAAKTVKEVPELPGTIYSVAKEIEALGGEALPLQLDVRKEEQWDHVIEVISEKFGALDILVHNAGALWWKKIVSTPVKRFDLVHEVNARATFIGTQKAIPLLLEGAGGHVIAMAPPIDIQALKGKVGYLMSKWGMTLFVKGCAQEMKGKPFSIHALWPKTAIQSQATIRFRLGEPKMWRKPTILADAVCALVSEMPGKRSGQVLIDETLLREKGVEDFKKYRVDPEVEPPALSLFDFPELG